MRHGTKTSIRSQPLRVGHVQVRILGTLVIRGLGPLAGRAWADGRERRRRLRGSPPVRDARRRDSLRPPRRDRNHLGRLPRGNGPLAHLQRPPREVLHARQHTPEGLKTGAARSVVSQVAPGVHHCDTTLQTRPREQHTHKRAGTRQGEPHSRHGLLLLLGAPGRRLPQAAA